VQQSSFPDGPQVAARPRQLGGVPPYSEVPPLLLKPPLPLSPVPPAVTVPPELVVSPGELVTPPGALVVPPGELVISPVVSVMPPPPVPMAFIGVREQASPVNDSTTLIANHPNPRIMPVRLSAMCAEGTRGRQPMLLFAPSTRPSLCNAPPSNSRQARHRHLQADGARAHRPRGKADVAGDHVLVARPAEHAEHVKESALAPLGRPNGLGQDGEQPALDAGGGQHGNYRLSMVYALQLQCSMRAAFFFQSGRTFQKRVRAREARLRIV